MRAVASILLLAAPLLAQGPEGAPGADPARLFPADTFAYLEVDASAVEACLPEWQIAKILGDPALAAFFKPAFEQLGLDPGKPVEAMLGKLPVKEVLEGRAAVGVRGMSVVVDDGLGKEWRFRVSPGAPVDAKFLFNWLGFAAAADTPAGRRFTFTIDVDFLAVGRPGPLAKALLGQALREMGGEVTRKPVKIKGLDATYVRVTTPALGDVSFAFNLYAVEREGTWLLGTQVDTLEQAIDGGPRASLASGPSLAQARATLTGGRPLLLAHVDTGLLLDVYRPLLPPVLREMGATVGLDSIRGVGFGMSLVDGGLRESFGFLLDGNPRGAWRILDGMPAGLRSIEVAPPGALGAVALKLDLKVLRERILALCSDVVPGNEEEIDRELVTETVPGFNLLTEVIPALKDEIAVIVYPAGSNEMLPRFVVGADARDEEALSRLIAKIQEMAPEKEARFVPVELPEGIQAVQVLAATPYDMHFAVHKGHLLYASNRTLLAEAATKWGSEGARSLVRDDPILPLVLKAVNGGDTRSLAALGYVNLRGGAVEALRWQMAWGRLIPKEWFDVRGATEMRRIPNHLTGAAIAFRHDKDAVVLDCFSPVGVLVPMVATGFFVVRQQVVRQVVIRQPPRTGRATLGINLKTSDGAGVKVLGLVAHGPSAAAGLRQGDRIVGFEGAAIATMEDLDRELAKKRPGETVVVTIRRGEAELEVTVELDEEQEAGW